MSDTPVLDGKVMVNRMLPPEADGGGSKIVRVEEYDECFDIEASEDIGICKHCDHCHKCGVEVYACEGDICEGEIGYHKHHICKKCGKCLGWCCTCPGWVAPHRREHFEFVERERLASERKAHEERMAELGLVQHTLAL